MVNHVRLDTLIELSGTRFVWLNLCYQSLCTNETFWMIVFRTSSWTTILKNNPAMLFPWIYVYSVFSYINIESHLSLISFSSITVLFFRHRIQIMLLLLWRCTVLTMYILQSLVLKILKHCSVRSIGLTTLQQSGTNVAA